MERATDVDAGAGAEEHAPRIQEVEVALAELGAQRAEDLRRLPTGHAAHDQVGAG